MDIEASRKKIDELDDQLLQAFGERMKIVGDIAEYKAERGLPIYDPQREREVLAGVVEKSAPGLEMASKVLFQVMMDLSRSHQIQLIRGDHTLSDRIRASVRDTDRIFPQSGTVACQGVEGAYSQIAADRLFPLGNLLYFKNFEGVFNAVQSGLCRYGVLPIENSSAGTVTAVYDLMRHYNFHIIRSMKMKIDHQLLTKNKKKLSDIHEVYSHTQAIGQCSRFLSSHPEIKVNICENTAMAAKFVSESDRDDIAAIASSPCARIYSLTPCPEKIQNSESNFTRFICISKEMKIFPGADKISIMLSLPHTPGSLYNFMSKFASLGLNLTKLASRPIEGSDFEFRFFVDFDASVYSDEALNMLDELATTYEEFTFLGSYSEV